MEFNFSKNGLNRKEALLQRFFEILPGAMSWTIILGSITLAFWKPLSAAVFIIAFDFYWLLRMLYITLFLTLSYFRLSIERDTDWMGRIKDLDEFNESKKIPDYPVRAGFKAALSNKFHLGKLKDAGKKALTMPFSKDIYHLVVIPVSKETEDIVEPGIISIAEAAFPSEKIFIAIALENRADRVIKEGVQRVLNKHRGKFFDLMIIFHGSGIPGEARVKGANVTAAAKKAAERLKEKSIDFSNVIVSCFDSDTVVSKEYFACLTYNFMLCPHRTRASFQPIPVYYNNIWDVPGFARVLETGSSFFQLVEATNPEKLVTFSSHSMSFKALVDVGYWPVDMISDDSAIYWKSYIKFDGHYKVVPIYTTVSMDIVAADSWWQTIVNEYKQKRRWAWGVENFPIVARGFLKNKKISLYNRARLLFKLLDGHISWTTWPFLLTFIGWIPGIVASRVFKESVLCYSVPRITGTIFNLASFSLIASIVLSLSLLPRSKKPYQFFSRVAFAFEWLLIPLIILFLSAIPALDAQTKLMLGKRMEFWVAQKRSRV